MKHRRLLRMDPLKMEWNLMGNQPKRRLLNLPAINELLKTILSSLSRSEWRTTWPFHRRPSPPEGTKHAYPGPPSWQSVWKIIALPDRKFPGINNKNRFYPFKSDISRKCGKFSGFISFNRIHSIHRISVNFIDHKLINFLYIFILNKTRQDWS